MPADRRSRAADLIQRVVHTLWVVPSLVIVGTLGLVGGCLWLDAAGASAILEGWGRPFDIDAKAAVELASTLQSASTAFAALLFSITLLVLTIAAGNLGVRFVDRWVQSLITRLAIGLYPALVGASTLVLGFIDPTRPFVPRLSLLVVLTGFVLSLFCLVAMFHHLSRLMHVDTSLTSLGDSVTTDARESENDPDDPLVEGDPWSIVDTLAAPETGYLESVDATRMAEQCVRLGVKAVLLRPIGTFVPAGAALLGCPAALDPRQRTALAAAAAAHIDVSAVRGDSDGPPFHVNLLVEAALRALSPAVNDQFTAVDAAHRLALCVLEGFRARVPAPGSLADADGKGAFRYPPNSVLCVLDRALPVFRRTVRHHPTVTCAFLETLADAAPFASRAVDLELIIKHSKALADEAVDVATSELDRTTIRQAKAQLDRALAEHGALAQLRSPAVSPT